jgi:hypothetical protein
MSVGRFDWGDLEPADIVAPSQLETAVYLNTDNDLVIRRRPDGFTESDDVWIVIGQSYVPALIGRITAMYGLPPPIVESFPSHRPDPVALPPPTLRRDPTAAERQRRFRERRKQSRNAEHSEA